MAFNYLKDRDYGDDTNWSTGTKPAVNGEVIIPSSLGTNVDASPDQGTIDLRTLFVAPGYKHNFYTSAGPFKGAAGLVRVMGFGNFYMEASLGAGSLDINEFLCETQVNSAEVSIDSETGDLGEVDKIVCNRGTLTIGSDLVFPAAGELHVGWIKNRQTDANVTCTTTDTVPLYYQSGGVAHIQSTMTTVDVSGGFLWHENKAATTLNVHGGRVKYDFTALTTLNVYGGIVDLTFARELAIATVNLFEGGTIYGQFDEGLTVRRGPIVVTQMNKYGGTILPADPHGRFE